MSDSLRPRGLQPARLLHPRDFAGKSTGVGCHCLLRLPTDNSISVKFQNSITCESILGSPSFPVVGTTAVIPTALKETLTFGKTNLLCSLYLKFPWLLLALYLSVSVLGSVYDHLQHAHWDFT